MSENRELTRAIEAFEDQWTSPVEPSPDIPFVEWIPKSAKGDVSKMVPCVKLAKHTGHKGLFLTPLDCVMIMRNLDYIEANAERFAQGSERKTQAQGQGSLLDQIQALSPEDREALASVLSPKKSRARAKK